MVELKRISPAIGELVPHVVEKEAERAVTSPLEGVTCWIVTVPAPLAHVVPLAVTVSP